MNERNRKRYFGFTLMELMVVIVVISILVGLAYPSYVKYARKSKRGEAQQLLLNWSINQEIWRSNNPQYATVAQLPAPTGDHYNFAISNRTASSYTLTASAKAGDDQLNDKSRDGGTSCATMTLDQNGVKSPPDCWE